MDSLREHGFPRKTASPRRYCVFASRQGISYQAIFFGKGSNNARVYVYIDTADGEQNLRLYEALSRQKDHIESKTGLSLDWEPMPGNRACRIAATLPERGIDDHAEVLAETQAWMLDTLLDFKRVFGPLLEELMSGQP